MRLLRCGADTTDADAADIRSFCRTRRRRRRVNYLSIHSRRTVTSAYLLTVQREDRGGRVESELMYMRCAAGNSSAVR